MRKLRLLLFASLVAGTANAQYFQHTYGDVRRDFLESGINANPTQPQGHLMTGYTDLVGWDNFEVTRTDLDGRIGAPQTFNNRYPMTENAANVDAKGRRILQPQPLGGRILVWGDYGYNPGAVSTRFFLSLLNPNGNPGVTWSYRLPYNVAEAEATSMVYSNTQPNTVFACGFIRMVATGTRYPIAISINTNTGAVNWGRVYVLQGIDWWAADIVESPYATAAAPEAAIVGHFNRSGMVETGFFLRVNSMPGQGCPVAPVVEYGAPFAGNAGALNAIDIALSGFGSGQGYVLGGYCNNAGSGNDDFWALKIDPTGLIINFNTLIDYSNPGNAEYGFDIIERQTYQPAPYDYEYYVGGFVKNGYFGGEDALVQKLEFTGKPYPGTPQFTYGGGGNDRAYQLDHYTRFPVPPPNDVDGLSTFGTTDGSFSIAPGLLDFYFVRSYFNGITACNYDLQTPPYTGGPGIAETWNSSCQDQFIQGPLSINRVGIFDREICWTPNDAGGDNYRIAAEETAQQLFQPGYFPNPVSRDNALVTVTFGQEATDGDAEMELWNAVGQLVWKKSVSVSKGQTTMQVALGDALEGGMYHLVVRQNGALNNYRILVQ